MTNLKQVLMELGNELVLNWGFLPATGNPMDQVADSQNTQPIKDFTVWLNNTPEARQILAEKGFEWPVVEDKDERKNP